TLGLRRLLLAAGQRDLGLIALFVLIVLCHRSISFRCVLIHHHPAGFRRSGAGSGRWLSSAASFISAPAQKRSAWPAASDSALNRTLPPAVITLRVLCRSSRRSS